jgi:hypothetical protein
MNTQHPLPRILAWNETNPDLTSAGSLMPLGACSRCFSPCFLDLLSARQLSSSCRPSTEARRMGRNLIHHQAQTRCHDANTGHYWAHRCLLGLLCRSATFGGRNVSGSFDSFQIRRIEIKTPGAWASCLRIPVRAPSRQQRTHSNCCQHQPTMTLNCTTAIN